ncbi:MAG: ABC transporter permease [Desulfarculus sp.]|nr:ABC transporter permease [Desulfarculus sp.]
MRLPAVNWRAGAARLVGLLLVLWGVSLLTFTLQMWAPGDPAEVLLRAGSESPAPERVAELRRELGLDRSWPARYLTWLGRAARLDLGRSLRSGDPVTTEIAARLPATLELAGTSLVLVVLLSGLAGVWTAWRPGPTHDRLPRWISLMLVSLPPYWLGLLLITVLALGLGWLPAAGRDGWASLVLPSLTLSLGIAAMQGRVLRVGVLEVLGQDFVRFAHAKGLGRARVLWGHVLPAALGPLLALWGMTLGHLLGGAVVVETVFAWPGLGRLLVEAVLGRDWPLVQGLVLFMTLALIAANQAADLALRLLDPRQREGDADVQG